ncbi:VOC family protein [Thioalkalivibrio sp. AKL19]|uniref:VOC family protein n=1 Tax=Thioalkalivibrio sp. AKL19 TaxID=1266914 RepID=UPI0003F5F559|nr:VOC family protein [Thioalkalivibrio sp. AKL19]
MAQILPVIGSLEPRFQQVLERVLGEFDLRPDPVTVDEPGTGKPVSLNKTASRALREAGTAFYNWDLLFDNLGPDDVDGEIEPKLRERVRILQAVRELDPGFASREFHGSIRVHDLATSARFYTWLFGVEPAEWTHRYVTFLRPDTRTNFVLLVNDGMTLNHDTLFHLGMGVADKHTVVRAWQSARNNDFHVEKPPRTTWRGTPLHELWLKDPDGTLIEIYAMLTQEELEQMPPDQEPVFLVQE